MSVVMDRKFNDRILTEGFPPRWYVQDRLDEGTALLCRRTDMYPGNTCICLRPRAQPTDDWLPTARMIAWGFERMLDHERRDRIASAGIEDADDA